MNRLSSIVFTLLFIPLAMVTHGSSATSVATLKKKAEGGDATAQAKLAGLYVSGDGVTKDYAEALKWYKKAAAQGSAAAQNGLGDMYYYEHGVPQYYEEAVKWYRLSAEQGYAEGQHSMSLMYYHGRGVPRGYGETRRWIHLSAKQGYAQAQDDLGWLYANGKGGLPRNYEQAVKWYRLAAEQGHASAQHNLGHSYWNGNGVSQDYNEAKKWFKLAMEQAEQSDDYETRNELREHIRDIEEAIASTKKRASENRVASSKSKSSKDSKSSSTRASLTPSITSMASSSSSSSKSSGSSGSGFFDTMLGVLGTAAEVYVAYEEAKSGTSSSSSGSYSSGSSGSGSSGSGSSGSGSSGSGSSGSGSSGSSDVAEKCKRQLPQSCENKLKATENLVPDINPGSMSGLHHLAYCRVKVLADAYDGCTQDYKAVGLDECALLTQKQAFALHENANETKRSYGMVTGGQDTSSFTLDCSANAWANMKEAPAADGDGCPLICACPMDKPNCNPPGCCGQ